MEANDGRQVHGHLQEVIVANGDNPVVQVIEESTGEILYTRRIQGSRFRPPVYAPGRYTLKAGRDRPDQFIVRNLSVPTDSGPPLKIQW
jgi:hypothetical protein